MEAIVIAFLFIGGFIVLFSIPFFIILYEYLTDWNKKKNKRKAEELETGSLKKTLFETFLSRIELSNYVRSKRTIFSGRPSKNY